MIHLANFSMYSSALTLFCLLLPEILELPGSAVLFSVNFLYG